MNEDQAIDLVGGVAVVAFIGVSLLRRRYPMHVWQVMIPLWTAIIGAVWFVVDLVLKWRGH